MGQPVPLELFVRGADQERVARAYVAQLEAARAFGRSIVMRIGPARPFYPAGGIIRTTLERHPDAPCIAFNDMAKVRGLQALLPQDWQPAPVTLAKSATRG